MEQIKKQYSRLLQAYKRLEYTATKFEKLSQDPKSHTPSAENDFLECRDSLIKRFEFCYDLTWKFLKILLEKKHGIEASSPRKVFHECFTQGLITREEAEMLNEMVDSRNLSSHVYDEETADRISKEIPHYYRFLMTFATKLKP